MTNIQTVESNARKVEARRILEAQLPEALCDPKREAFPEQVPCWRQTMLVVARWALQGGAVGINMQGGTGRGKTQLASYALCFLADVCGKKALWLNERAVSAELKLSYDKIEGARREGQILQEASERDVIAFDDVGSAGNENEALHVKRLLCDLVDLADSQRKLFIMTGNLDDEGLARLLGDERVESRQALWERVVFPSKMIPDYRKRR